MTVEDLLDAFAVCHLFGDVVDCSVALATTKDTGDIDVIYTLRLRLRLSLSYYY